MTIRRSDEDVFTFLADFEKVPTWNHAIMEMRKVSKERWPSEPPTAKPDLSRPEPRRLWNWMPVIGWHHPQRHLRPHFSRSNVDCRLRPERQTAYIWIQLGVCPPACASGCTTSTGKGAALRHPRPAGIIVRYLETPVLHSKRPTSDCLSL